LHFVQEEKFFKIGGGSIIEVQWVFLVISEIFDEVGIIEDFISALSNVFDFIGDIGNILPGDGIGLLGEKRRKTEKQYKQERTP
jgi:hypothetical protein